MGNGGAPLSSLCFGHPAQSYQHTHGKYLRKERFGQKGMFLGGSLLRDARNEEHMWSFKGRSSPMAKVRIGKLHAVRPLVLPPTLNPKP